MDNKATVGLVGHPHPAAGGQAGSPLPPARLAPPPALAGSAGDQDMFSEGKERERQKAKRRIEAVRENVGQIGQRRGETVAVHWGSVWVTESGSITTVNHVMSRRERHRFPSRL